MEGYTDNGYHLWSQEDERIISGRDVIFDETKFEHSQPFIETNCQEEKENECKEESNEEEFTSTDNEENNDRTLLEKELVSEEEEETAIKSETPKEQSNILRRSTRLKKKTQFYHEDYCVLALHAESYVEDVPNCYAEVNSRHDKEEWKKAVNNELKAQEKNSSKSDVESSETTRWKESNRKQMDL